MTTTIEDNISLDDIEGDDALGDTYIVPHFIPAIRTIMWWFPCAPGVAEEATETHVFCHTFSTLSAT